MKFAYLVAWREYAENAKTKGFWIGIFVLPVILFLSIQTPIWLDQKGTPVRYYVIADQSGSFETVVESAVEKGYQKRMLEALKEYSRKNGMPSKAITSQLLQMDENTPRVLESFIASGGKEYFVERLKP